MPELYGYRTTREIRRREVGGRWTAALFVCWVAAGAASGEAPEQLVLSRGEAGKPGGRLVVALNAEPRTFNPLTAVETSAVTIADMTTADLIHIDRVSQRPEPALARSWTVSGDGRSYTLELRRGLRFSDGHPCDADDVVFSFRAYLDPQIASPQRDMLVVGGEPISVTRVDSGTVRFTLAEPYAAAERLFDSFAILPRHLLEDAYRRGELAQAWGLGTPADRIAGLGPFRIKSHQPGERLILERNPYYWKQDSAGTRLPYLEQLVFMFVASEDAQVLRFQAGEIDVIDRLSAASFSLLAAQGERRGYRVHDLGPGLDYNFLFFNLNPLAGDDLPQVAMRQAWFRRKCFRQAVSEAIDRQGIVRLVYRNLASPLVTHVTPGSRYWVHSGLPPPVRSPEEARRQLEGCGFRHRPDGALTDAAGQPVEFTIMTVASSVQRTRMAAIIQQDLAELGIKVNLASLELPAILERLFQSHDYDACVLGLGGGDADPNPAMNVLLSNGTHHLWHLGQNEPATPWEAEIDDLMRRQLVTLDPARRKRLYDRVQEIMAEELPLIGLASPNVLVGAKVKLRNFRPAVLEHHTLWNVEELFWQGRRLRRP